MNTGFILALLYSFLLWGCANKKGAIIAYNSRIINMGEVNTKEAHVDSIVIYNRGDKVLEILKVESDCDCTVTEMKKRKILPGDSSYIHFNIKPNVAGAIQQSIFVDNNSINESRVLFLVRAKVLP